jgi:DNA repair ATPase RecN
MGQIDTLDQSYEKKQIEEAHQQLIPFIMEVMEKEQELRQELEKQRQEVSDALRKMQMAKKMNRSYNIDPYNVEGYFVDKTIGLR